MWSLTFVDIMAVGTRAPPPPQYLANQKNFKKSFYDDI